MTEQNSIKSPEDTLIDAYCDVIDAAAAIASEVRWFAPSVRNPLAFSIKELDHLYDLTDSLHSLDGLNAFADFSNSVDFSALAKFHEDQLNSYKNKTEHLGFYSPHVSYIRAGIGFEDKRDYRAIYLFHAAQGFQMPKEPARRHFYPKSAVKILHQYVGGKKYKENSRMHLLNSLVDSVKKLGEASAAYRNTHQQSQVISVPAFIQPLGSILSVISRVAAEMRLYSSYANSKVEPLRSEPDFNDLEGLAGLVIQTRAITASIRSRDPQRIYSTAKTIISDLKPYLELASSNPFSKPDLLSAARAPIINGTATLIYLYADSSKVPEFLKKPLSCSTIGKKLIDTYVMYQTDPCGINRLYLPTMAIHALDSIIKNNQAH